MSLALAEAARNISIAAESKIDVMKIKLAQLQFLLMTAKTGAAQQAPIYPQ